MRALLLVLDSVGVGDAPDAAEYGDQGANTLGHIFEHRPDLRLRILETLGLSAVIGQKARGGFRASFGRMRENLPAKIRRRVTGKSRALFCKNRSRHLQLSRAISLAQSRPKPT